MISMNLDEQKRMKLYFGLSGNIYMEKRYPMCKLQLVYTKMIEYLLK